MSWTRPSRRRDFLRALIASPAGGYLSSALLGQTPPLIHAEKLTDTLSMLTGDGGNVLIVKGDGELMMIDGGFPERATELLGAVSENVDAHHITRVFNTHWHIDHIGCNETLGKSGARIMAHENVRKRLSVRTTIEAINRTVEPLKPEGLPTENFTHGGKLTFGKEKIEYRRVDPAHTDGDSYLFFPGPNILHTGDLLFNGFYPLIDYSTGGWIGGMAAACAHLAKVGDSKTRVIPGHGKLGSIADIKASGEMLGAIHERLAKMADQGKSADEVAAAAPAKDFDEKWGRGGMKPDIFVRMAYTSILRHRAA